MSDTPAVFFLVLQITLVDGLISECRTSETGKCVFLCTTAQIVKIARLGKFSSFMVPVKRRIKDINCFTWPLKQIPVSVDGQLNKKLVKCFFFSFFSGSGFSDSL